MIPRDSSGHFDRIAASPGKHCPKAAKKFLVMGSGIFESEHVVDYCLGQTSLPFA